MLQHEFARSEPLLWMGREGVTSFRFILNGSAR
jgi:hypothetical protein